VWPFGAGILPLLGRGYLPIGKAPTRHRPDALFRSPFIYPIHTLMLTGTVKFYNDSKGFGFIIADDNEEEIFVHQTGLIHEIQEGDKVQFNIKDGKKGPNAVDVTRLQ
jgi:CspA family cold shock protein